jgi:hypothetical protein
MEYFIKIKDVEEVGVSNAEKNFVGFITLMELKTHLL